MILVEADGSKRLPVKVPGPKEPVIPENSDQILCIYGLGALGKQAADCCFRMQPSEQLLKIPEDQKDGKWIMTEEKMSLLMKKGYLEPLRQQFPYSQVIPGSLPGRYHETGRKWKKHSGKNGGRTGNINRRTVEGNVI